MYLDEVKAIFNNSNIVATSEVVGCTEEEVRTLENLLGLRLPAAYKEFLFWMGHGAGSFLQGTDIFYEHILPIQAWAIDLLAENNVSEHIPPDAIVFFMHQGYQFAFLRSTEGDDPQPYYFNEGLELTSISTPWSSFSEFLLKELEAHRGSRQSRDT